MECNKEIVVISNNSGGMQNVVCYDPSTDSILKTYKNVTVMANRCVSILGSSYFLAADISKSHLYFWPVNSKNPIHNLHITTLGTISALSCTPNGSFVVGAVEKDLHIWQMSTKSLSRTISRHNQAVTCLKFTQDGLLFVSGGQDGHVFVWSLANIINNNEEVSPKYEFADHILPIKDICLGYISSSTRLISVSLDCTARIYDMHTGIQISTIISKVPIISVCMDFREYNLFFGYLDGVIRQYNLYLSPQDSKYHTDEFNENVIKGHTGEVTCLSIFIDCISLLSGGLDGIVNLWNIQSRQLIKKIIRNGSIITTIFTSAFLFNNEIDLKRNLEIDGSLNDIQEKLVETTRENKRLKQVNYDMYKHMINYLTRPEEKQGEHYTVIKKN